ncbi:hypothetical protein AB4X43_000503 [Escherichia coli]
MKRHLYAVPLDRSKVDNFPHNHHNDETYGGGNGGGGDMLQRIKILEDKVATMATDIAVIKSNYATSANVESVKTDIANAKAELHSAMRLQAMAIIGSVLATVGTGVGLIIKMMPSLPH